MTSYSITVQWEAVDCIQRNGNITGYSVRYGIAESGTTQEMDVLGGVTEANIIDNVIPSTTYFITVAAMNSVGTGPYSDRVTTETDSECSYT